MQIEVLKLTPKGEEVVRVFKSWKEAYLLRDSLNGEALKLGLTLREARYAARPTR